MSAQALTAVLQGRYAADFKWRYLPQSPAEGDLLSSGLPELDALAAGLPRGGITELTGPVSSGRTSILYAVLASAAAEGETCALVDADDTFDPVSAEEAGVRLDRLVWVRCGGDTERAMKAADLLLQGGGFGLVAMDLGDTAPRSARRISLASWYRFRRAVENTRTAMLLIGQEPYARQCALLALEVRRDACEWKGAAPVARRLNSVALRIERRKPAGRAGAASLRVAAA
jgi:hypothetical protein